MSRSTESDRIGSRCWRVCGADLINRGGHDQVTVALNMIMVENHISCDFTQTISCFFCSKNMHRVDTENLTEDKQVSNSNSRSLKKSF